MATEEEIVSDLAVTYARVAHLGWLAIKEEQPGTYDDIRHAGERLNELGGLTAMRDATAELFSLTDGQFSTGADFNRLWDGVGTWRARMMRII